MVRLSKRKLSPETLSKLYDMLAFLFVQSKTSREVSSILHELIPPTERIMIGKRVGIILLLIKGVTLYDITRILKVSKATVSKVNQLIENRESLAAQKLTRMLSKEKLSHLIEDIFMALLLQPGIKIGHHKLKYEYERQRLKRETI